MAELEVPGAVRLLELTIWVPTVRDEDAEPLLSPPQEGVRWSGAVAVFDGLGGAGSTILQTPDGERTSAYCASRLAREVVSHYVSGGATGARTTSELVEELKSLLGIALKQRASEIDSPPTALLTNLIKRLPTTMACVLFPAVDPRQEAMPCLAVWAGDSRAFVLSPVSGLQQLSRDHLRTGADALENLDNDSPMSNYLNADTPFALSHSEVDIQWPAALLAASDGCFAHLATPAHFEALLLETLHRSQSIEGWKEDLEARLREEAADDSSLALVGLGWDTFDRMREALAERLTFVTQHYVTPADEAEGTPEYGEIRRSIWEEYRLAFEALLPGALEETG